jgi:hypothetical protein
MIPYYRLCVGVPSWSDVSAEMQDQQYGTQSTIWNLPSQVQTSAITVSWMYPIRVKVTGPWIDYHHVINYYLVLDEDPRMGNHKLVAL